ncbi:YqhG family protein [Alicyclobacillus dauci]|uniref:YqhG family protein n=1 Tax=Alicyclobacillus dauci TaxID=1475485 RepID=A0ABY6Z837_9BACL|nr:YqhG family protein [Alicyclobacillus dauci]WAH38987.1 YqhG family protein [Alicyclobacillus dauci]
MTSIPLRKDEERLAFCDAYFAAVGAEQLRTAEMYREVRLPLDVDKELTDRPFFWLWAEKTNQTIEPTTLRLAFSEVAKEREDNRLADEHRRHLEANPPQNPYERMFARPKQSEYVNLGSFRLNKIIDSVSSRGKYACVMPQHVSHEAECIPWLLVNGLIQFVADSVQEQWFSIGVCLTNRQTVLDFYSRLQRIHMKPCDMESLLRVAAILPSDGLDSVRSHIERHIEHLPHAWAQEAERRLEDDLSQLDAYYTSILPDYDDDEKLKIQAEHQRKRDELLRKSSPHIDVIWTQVALVGLPLRQS